MNSNPIVTYDEIVEALKSILECSLNSNYVDDFNYLNVKYESGTKNKIDSDAERALYNAIKSLEKNFETSSKIIRAGLEKELSELEKNVLKINTNYLIGEERRRLSAQIYFVEKLKNISQKKDILLCPPTVDDEEDLFISFDDIDTNKVFSDFEKKVIADFPDYFQEEIELANSVYHNDIEIENNYIEPTTTQTSKDRLKLLRGAIEKAKKIGNRDLIQKLEEKYEEEKNKG